MMFAQYTHYPYQLFAMETTSNLKQFRKRYIFLPMHVLLIRNMGFGTTIALVLIKLFLSKFSLTL